MIFDKITFSADITSGGADSVTALTFDASNSPMKVVRFYGTMGSFTPLVSGHIDIYSDTEELLYQSATIAPTGSINSVLDCNVYPGYSVRFTTTGDIGPGDPTVIAKMHLEK